MALLGLVSAEEQDRLAVWIEDEQHPEVCSSRLRPEFLHVFVDRSRDLADDGSPECRAALSEQLDTFVNLRLVFGVERAVPGGELVGA